MQHLKKKIAMKVHTRKRWLTCSAILLLCLLISSHARAEILAGAGATFPYPLYSRWFNAYRAAHISYQPVGSAAGIKALKEGAVDFAASDSPLSIMESQAMGRPVVHIPTAGRAIAIVYNLPELGQQKKQLRLNGRVLAGIYAGLITHWNDPRLVQLNPGVQLSNRTITTIRTDHRSASRLFASYLFAASPMWRRSVGLGEPDDSLKVHGGRMGDGIAAHVRSTPGSISYVEFAYATQNRLSYAAIQNDTGQFINPSVEGVVEAIANSIPRLRRDLRSLIVNAPGTNSYPISGLTYILLHKSDNDKVKRAALIRFLHWTMTTGQRDASSLLYAPLPYLLVQINQAVLHSIK
jgi:phosphate transport system substrate-binding protein